MVARERYERLRPPRVIAFPVENRPVMEESDDVSMSRVAVKFADVVRKPKICLKQLVMTEQEPMQLLAAGLEASTEDDPGQTIQCTLEDSTRSFWSSKGTADDTSSEFIVYQMHQPICVVTRIEITPYKARFQRGMPIYAPRSVTVSVGFHKELDKMHYVSPMFPVANVDVPQSFDIKPTLVVGQYLRLDLHGRNQRQPNDNLFYTVLQSVKCYGLPLAAFPDLLTLHDTFSRLVDAFTHTQTPTPTQSSNSPIRDIPDTHLTPLLKTRRETTNAMTDLYRLLDQGDWKSAARMIASKRKRSDLRSRDVLTWFFVRAEWIADGCVSDSGSPTKKGKGKAAESPDSEGGVTGRSWADAVGVWFDGESDDDDDEVDGEDSEGDSDEDDGGPVSRLLNNDLRDEDLHEPRKYYLWQLVRRDEDLNAFESLELAHLAIRERRFQRFWGYLRAGKLECTEELGDVFRPVDMSVALQIYSRANVLDKMIDCLLARGQFYMAIRLVRATGQYEFAQIVRQMRETKGVRSAVAFTILVLREEPNIRPALLEALGVGNAADGVANEDLAAWLSNWAGHLPHPNLPGGGASSSSSSAEVSSEDDGW
ncbi:hypothetical protein HK097_008029 [Rhizophlyctis rosea]|uniref:Uncharacterized protein n=1 Tax=Rhizophlyctis rosea TaxID=64517 RepID=A0AAD5SDP0_9FUNG|nr:hypothetical protein HK097_008029 [Rhizophlyctis rosea]